VGLINVRWGRWEDGAARVASCSSWLLPSEQLIRKQRSCRFLFFIVTLANDAPCSLSGFLTAQRQKKVMMMMTENSSALQHVVYLSHELPTSAFFELGGLTLELTDCETLKPDP
jgi:hypothetical protein